MPPKRIPLTCQSCSCAFHGRPSGRFCSKSCVWAATKGPDFNRRVSQETAAKRGDALRGSGSGSGYVKRGGRHEHRVVAESVLGRQLTSDEIVHHIDENKSNNDPSNLRVMTQGEHMREHGLGVPGMKLPWMPWTKRGQIR